MLQEVITAVLVEEGDTVKEGQPLVQLRVGEGGTGGAAHREADRTSDVQIQGLRNRFSTRRWAARKSRWRKQAQLELAKILHRAAEAAFKEKTIRAPLAGIVVKKYKEAGESVDRVEKLMDIVNIDQVYVQFYLDPKLMTSMREGQEVPVKFPVLDNAEFTGKVTFIDPRIDAGSGFFRIKVLIENE